MRHLLLLGAAFVGVGCGSYLNIVPIDSNHSVLSQAQVSLNGSAVGSGTVRVERPESAVATIDAGPGWLTTTTQIGPQTPDTLEVVVPVDELYRSTIEDSNQIINRWLTMEVSEEAEADGSWWSTIDAAIAGQDFEMEMLDQGSGFIRSAWRERSYPGVSVRRRFVGNVVGQTPLRWRIKYQVEVRYDNQQNWVAYDRGFRDELDALIEIRSRFSHQM